MEEMRSTDTPWCCEIGWYIGKGLADEVKVRLRF
jgi:hypothetical protein